MKPMEFGARAARVMEREVEGSAETLEGLVERLGSMGLGDSVTRWLDGDPGQSFFEFTYAQSAETDRAHRDVELLCTKTYTPSGLVTVSIYFGGVYYMSLQAGNGEQPLLDSKFPNVAGKGRGYQIKQYSEGVEEWRSLRKVAVWQTKEAMEREMEERMTQVRSVHVCSCEPTFISRERGRVLFLGATLRR